MPTNILSKKVERFPSLFEDFLKPWNDILKTGEGWGKMITVPAVNITENKENYIVSMAVPGMKKNDFNINLEADMLTISSEKEDDKEEEGQDYKRREYSYTSFSRSFNLPEEVNKEKIEAAYEDGVLKLILPKKEEAKRVATFKQISVK